MRWGGVWWGVSDCIVQDRAGSGNRGRRWTVVKYIRRVFSARPNLQNDMERTTRQKSHTEMAEVAPVSEYFLALFAGWGWSSGARWALDSLALAFVPWG